MYAYQKMPFGMINVGATFQRAMDIFLKGLVTMSVAIYLDDITMYSKKCSSHLKDLNRSSNDVKSMGSYLIQKIPFLH